MSLDRAREIVSKVARPPVREPAEKAASESMTLVLNLSSPGDLARLRRALGGQSPKVSHAVRVLKADAEADADAATPERYVFGVVLVPDDVDSQGDVYDAAEVRKAAFAYMEKYGGKLGLNHAKGPDGKALPLDGKVKVLETYVSKQAETHNGESFPAGTWFLGVRVVDDDLWARVEKGELTGFSIGGTAVREPISEAQQT